jgi:diamine N-acetyltransferase
MDLQFEIATPTHLPYLLAMQQDFYALDNYTFSAEKAEPVLLHFLANPALGIIWVIKIENPANIIGYVALNFCYSFEFGGRIAFLDELFLKTEFRHQGLGSQVLTYVLEQAQRLGLRVLHLEAERHNIAGKALYHKFGFRDHDRHLMTKVLAE